MAGVVKVKVVVESCLVMEIPGSGRHLLGNEDCPWRREEAE